MAAANANTNANSELFTYLIDEKNRFTINKFINAVLPDPSPPTRSQLKMISSGCRYWQLVIGVLFTLQRQEGYNLVTILEESEETNPSYNTLVDRCKDIIVNITSENNHDFYDFFFNHDPNSLVEEYTDATHIVEGINYLCIYDYDTIENEYIISHYFMIIKRGEQYYLSSSYGSDFVCVPYSTSILNISDFLTFVEALGGISQLISNEEKAAHWTIIQHFYNTYFLKGNLPVRINQYLRDNNPSMFKKIKGTRLKQGPEIEFKNVFKNKDTRYFIGIVPRYEKKIKSAILRTNIQINPSNNQNNPSKRRRLGGRSRKRKRKIRRTCKRQAKR
jgi:hypothetical protein